MRASRAIAIVLAVFAATLQRSAAAAEPLQLSFGVYTSDRPTDMYKAFKPILVHLESTLSKSLERPVQIRLRVFNSYDQARTALVDEDLDFARFGPSSYILAKEANPRIHLLAVEEQEGGLTFKGVVFTTEQTGVKRIADLRGKSFAFGDMDSTIGRYLAQQFLVDAGIYAKDLSKFDYLQRHDRVVEAVLAGKFDAGAAKEGTVAKFKGKGVKVLETFDNVTKPWVARSKLDAKIIRAIEQCLEETRDEKILDAIGEKITGFSIEHAKDEIYDSVRRGMKKADDFIKGPPQPGSSPADSQGSPANGGVPAVTPETSPPAEPGDSKSSGATSSIFKPSEDELQALGALLPHLEPISVPAGPAVPRSDGGDGTYAAAPSAAAALVPTRGTLPQPEPWPASARLDAAADREPESAAPADASAPDCSSLLEFDR